MAWKKPRWFRKLELYSLCGVWAVVGLGSVVASYRLLMWSFGGREGFRFIVMQLPLEEEWHRANPRAVLGLDTPLSNVPKFLETPGHGEVGKDHPHQRNY